MYQERINQLTKLKSVRTQKSNSTKKVTIRSYADMQSWWTQR